MITFPILYCVIGGILCLILGKIAYELGQIVKILKKRDEF